MSGRTYTGINIQYPISQLIISGKKIVETRTYPIPRQYIGQDMVLIETPGKEGKFKARMIAIIRFGDSFRYKNSKHFYSDSDKHSVLPGSLWAWDSKTEKWGWPILKIKRLGRPLPVPKKKGIVYTKEIELKG